MYESWLSMGMLYWNVWRLNNFLHLHTWDYFLKRRLTENIRRSACASKLLDSALMVPMWSVHDNCLVNILAYLMEIAWK